MVDYYLIIYILQKKCISYIFYTLWTYVYVFCIQQQIQWFFLIHFLLRLARSRRGSFIDPMRKQAKIHFSHVP